MLLYIHAGVALKSDKKTNRFFELEGLRGIAAIMVVLSHFMSLFYPQSFQGVNSIAPLQHMRFEDNLYGSPIAVLWSGTFAVAIFFILSGFVLSIGFLQTGKLEIIKKLAAKRYIRLVLPAFASVLGCYLLIKFGLGNTQKAAAFTGASDLAAIWNLHASIWDAIKDSFWGVFFSNASSYNSVLWTMTIEFFGSFLVFGTMILMGSSRYRWVAYLGLLAVTFNSWFFAFIIGLILADLYSHNYIRKVRRSWLLMGALVVVALFLGGYPYGENVRNTVYGTFSILPLSIEHIQMISLTIGAALLVLTVLSFDQLSGLLRKKRISILGKYTFSLYLVHLPIIFTFSTGIFAWAHNLIGYNKAVVLCFVSSLPLIWITTILFEKYVDSKSVQLSSEVADIYLGNKEFKIRKSLMGLRTQLILAASRFNRRKLKSLQPSLEAEVEQV